jgi:hypothetical protein
MKSFEQFIEKVQYINSSSGQKVKCYNVIPYAMAPGGKACAKKSSSSSGGNGD